MGKVVIEANWAFILVYFIEGWIHMIIAATISMLIMSVVLQQVSLAYPWYGSSNQWSILLLCPGNSWSFAMHLIVWLMVATNDPIQTLALTRALLLLVKILWLLTLLLLVRFSLHSRLFSRTLTLMSIRFDLVLVTTTDSHSYSLRIKWLHCNISSSLPTMIALQKWFGPVEYSILV